MSPNRQSDVVQRQVPGLVGLPRPLYGRVESLPNQALTFIHSHPWVQLSYAISGVLEVQTAGARFLAPPQRAVWVPAGVEHRVFSSAGTEMRSLYIASDAVPWGAESCQVLAVSPLLRELIDSFSAVPVEYDEAGAPGRLAAVLLDQLCIAPSVELSLPLPSDERLQAICAGLAEPSLQHLGLAEWGLRLRVSERTLSRLFLRDTGLSFRQWRQRYRLLEALVPLERGERVTDVALACGYDSLSAFIAAFRQQYGTTPGEFFRR
ncbi:helix-turn-helix transcriptional regulator [Pseudomonas sp. PDM16]|uniref:AraC family transcriptional regulator n=1 Tax=Pseudomonas sp. PDM16 TaxID=2769292 RepID=UPI001783070A|nr:helix-turn-helix transcriptional regulator [Pseudomonas sp. PDM16]MBD9413394.1 helix-turn-helix transcriptional regulator [Pseudomonas sp. PDM16]